MKRTPWFGGARKPAHVGVYERKLPQSGRLVYSTWDGQRWWYSVSNPKEAADVYGIDSAYQSIPWRGLAEKPKGMK